jgi:hypothetical protein
MPRTKTANAQAVYALFNIYYKGAEPQFAFSFHASDDEDAKDKAWKWGRYHSFHKDDYTVALANDEQSQCIRDQYIPR